MCLAGNVADLLRPELPRLERRISELRSRLDQLPRLSSGHSGVRLGYHGTFTPIANKPYWFTIDLGKPFPIDAIVLVPAHSLEGSAAMSGYGFPRRFRIIASNDPAFKTFETIADETAHDFPNPGPYPYFVRGRGARERYIQVMATKRWPQSERMWAIAFSELMVLSGGKDVALGAKVIPPGLHAIRHPPVWMEDNLVDGQTDLGLPVSREPSPSNGYESARAPFADSAKWVQVDLGESVPIEDVRLIPAHPPDYPAPGYGFPLRFRVEISQRPDFETKDILGDYTREDFLNPGDNMVIVPGNERRGRYIRLTATRLSDDYQAHVYSFALAELQVFVHGSNVALNKPVSAMDAQNDPRAPWQVAAFPEGPRWQLRFLVDGYGSRNRLMDLSSWLEGLALRGQLTRELAGAEAQYAAAEKEAAGMAITLGSIVTSIVAGGLAIFAWWSRRRRNNQIRELRGRLACDLHDEIGSSLGSIRLTSQIACHTPGLPPSAQEDFEMIERVSSETADSMRDIIWLLEGESVTAAELVSQMKMITERMLADRKYAIHVLPGSSQNLTLHFRRNLLFAFKEALYNAVRHSGAGLIEVEIDGTRGHFGFRVRDDGCGFDIQQVEEGHGLQNLRSRAGVLQGAASVVSEVGRGTLVEFRAPVA